MTTPAEREIRKELTETRKKIRDLQKREGDLDKALKILRPPKQSAPTAGRKKQRRGPNQSNKKQAQDTILEHLELSAFTGSFHDLARSFRLPYQTSRRALKDLVLSGQVMVTSTSSRDHVVALTPKRTTVVKPGEGVSKGRKS